jgi:hypothetical protein
MALAYRRTVHGAGTSGTTDSRERGADRRRKQQEHSPNLAVVPSGDQAFRVREHLSRQLTRLAAASSVGFSLPLTFQLSAVKTHGPIVAEPGRMSTTPLRLG